MNVTFLRKPNALCCSKLFDSFLYLHPPAWPPPFPKQNFSKVVVFPTNFPGPSKNSNISLQVTTPPRKDENLPEMTCHAGHHVFLEKFILLTDTDADTVKRY